MQVLIYDMCEKASNSGEQLEDPWREEVTHRNDISNFISFQKETSVQLGKPQSPAAL